MKRPTYEELVECIYWMAIQAGLLKPDTKRDGFGRIKKEGERFDNLSVSAYEHTEAVLQELGILDEDGFLIGAPPPLTEEGVIEQPRPDLR